MGRLARERRGGDYAAPPCGESTRSDRAVMGLTSPGPPLETGQHYRNRRPAGAAVALLPAPARRRVAYRGAVDVPRVAR
ncbi:hypothetical protein GTS_39100 [Gandjariella thermophila]|uniref:Uncharacterized protein n=1 Tax=Gandjariella thermophila TaxID=1931992 RepID=A0A4D4JEE1_9PSEU|nr:hypothetical protein GTS_39100 [Gandjariella thermophila]